MIRGTAGRDVIVARGGNDRIYGLRGNDFICGNKGRDRIYGGRANDVIHGGGGDDGMFGGRGRDALDQHDEGHDFYDGGRGIDLIHMGGGPKGRSVVVDLGQGFVRVGSKRDKLAVGTFEVVYGTENPDVLRGDDDGNYLFGGFDSGEDVIVGRGGDDYLEPYDNSTSTLRGSEGNDSLVLPDATGDHKLFGGPGRDVVLTGTGVGSPYCQDGEDPEQGVVVNLTTGQVGSATVGSIEDIEGTTCNDTIMGGGGPNRLFGWDQDDSIEGGGGDDDIRGDAAFRRPPIFVRFSRSDGPEAGAGDDTLDGGDGSDSLDGGPGTDTCTNGETQQNCEP